YHSLNLRTPGGGTVLNWVKPAATDHAIVVMKADSGGPFILHPTINPPAAGQFGAAPTAATLDSFSIFEAHEGRELPRTTDDAASSALDITRITPVYLTVTGGILSVDTNPYVQQFNAPVSVAASATQEIAQRAAAPATPYTWVRFWARRFGAS